MSFWYSFSRRWLLTESVCLFLLLFNCVLLLDGCGVEIQKRVLVTPQNARSLDHNSAFLKAHMLDGRVYILSQWSVNSNLKIVSGDGKLLDANRDVLANGSFSIPFDSVAIFETNLVTTSPQIMAMSLVTGASVILSVYCITNPKACFGSCPTFYVDDGSNQVLRAEGFSSSVAPSLEAKDIDALYRTKPLGREFNVTMKNEALETHVVRYVDMLVVPKPQGGRVFVTPKGEFWQTTQIISPYHCDGPEGDCLSQIIAFDGIERKSLADSTFLGAKETVELEFDSVPDGKAGLVIAFRQSLLSTYLFYQTLAYMGSSVGDWYAKLQSGNESIRKRMGSIGQVLGGIEILKQDGSNNWIPVTQVSETGPLATDVRVVPLPDLGSGSQKIQLRFAKGHWRLDYVALTLLDKKVTPQRLSPYMVRHDTYLDSTVKDILIDTSQVLVTLPGDVYTLTYLLPDDYVNFELFLESRGYYMEWIRDEWLAEENPALARMMFLNPQKALKKFAPEFKKIEAEIEQQFWGSRYAR